MYLLGILSLISALIFNSYSTIKNLIMVYGYLALFILMLLEGSSLPVPSEVVLPLAGVFSAKGLLNFYPAFAACLLGSIGGLAIDYFIGYWLGKEVIYKHLKLFHIKKESLDAFDAWFQKNGIAAIFISRLLPVVRTAMSFPAGFARMRLRTFFSYSILGTFIWDLVLILYGFYFLSVDNAVLVLVAVAVFTLALYVLYTLALKKLRHGRRK